LYPLHVEVSFPTMVFLWNYQLEIR